MAGNGRAVTAAGQADDARVPTSEHGAETTRMKVRDHMTPPGAIMPPMLLADGVYKVDGLRAANAYLVAIDDGLLLVDSGIPGNAERIVAFIESTGRHATDLCYIVLTHCDIDHIGSVSRLKELTEARVAIHELDAPVLAGQQRSQKGGPLMAVFGRLFRIRHVAPDLLLKDGDVIGGLTVIHAPGHTAGSIVLVRGDGVVFSGDALLSDKNGQVRLPRPRLALDPAQAQVSAERIKALPIKLLCTGHGAPVHM
jgi:glyoxylase-like metal-dependent hydrolase (beta-lactamase superfamily II)